MLNVKAVVLLDTCIKAHFQIMLHKSAAIILYHYHKSKLVNYIDKSKYFDKDMDSQNGSVIGCLRIVSIACLS